MLHVNVFAPRALGVKRELSLNCKACLHFKFSRTREPKKHYECTMLPPVCKCFPERLSIYAVELKIN